MRAAVLAGRRGTGQPDVGNTHRLGAGHMCPGVARTDMPVREEGMLILTDPQK